MPESKFDLDSVLFFDIESTGLSRDLSHVYLIGCAFRENGSWKIRQYLAEHISEEGELVAAFLSFTSRFRTLVHFNGDSFDVPYIDRKAEIYELPERLAGMENYDILKRVRCAKKLLPMSKMNQKSVEAFLKIRRDDEMSGGELIPVYYEYQQTGSERLEEYLLLHNFDDIKGMLRISPIVNYADITDGQFSISGMSFEDGNLTVDAALASKLPRGIEKSGKDFLICASDDFMQVVIRAFCGTACYFLPDPKNYYYLPEEDRAVHKDLAQFVDSAHKVKATKKNCYIKKKSVFLPQEKVLFEPCFRLPESPKEQYFEADCLKDAQEEKIKAYLLGMIRK